MLSLFALSLALSAPASAAVQVAATPTNPKAVTSQSLVLPKPNGPAIVEDETAQPIDQMAIHPASGVCYKIRTYIFSKGENPKFVRETTCGPNRVTPKQTNRNTPGRTPQE